MVNTGDPERAKPNFTKISIENQRNVLIHDGILENTRNIRLGIRCNISY